MSFQEVRHCSLHVMRYSYLYIEYPSSGMLVMSRKSFGKLLEQLFWPFIQGQLLSMSPHGPCNILLTTSSYSFGFVVLFGISADTNRFTSSGVFGFQGCFNQSKM